MTDFVTNATFTTGFATNRWDDVITVSLAGKRTIGNNRNILQDSGDHILRGDRHATNKNDAILYDLRFNNGVNLDGTTQRFVNTFTRFELGAGDDVLDLTVNPGRGVPDYTNSVTAIGGIGRDSLWTGYGNDTVYGDDATGSLIDIDIGLGGEGFSDTIHGGDGHDRIYGDFGDLSLLNVSVTLGNAQLGADLLYGGNGDDIIYGDLGQFSLLSVSISALGGGDDTIDGGAGNDTIYGDVGPGGVLNIGVSALTFGHDSINGGDGADYIVGDSAAGVLQNLSLLGVGNDRLYGDAGNDTIIGDFTGTLNGLVGGLNFGNDTIDGGDGNDLLIGDFTSTLPLTLTSLSFGHDNIKGGSGNDTIWGDTNNGVVLGITGGNDTIEGGGGNDELWGDFPALLNLRGGFDVFVFGPGSGQDTIKDFELGGLLETYHDRIDVSAYGITQFSQINFSVPFLGGDVTINFGGGNRVVVEGAALLGVNQLGAEDFIFA